MAIKTEIWVTATGQYHVATQPVTPAQIADMNKGKSSGEFIWERSRTRINFAGTGLQTFPTLTRYFHKPGGALGQYVVKLFPEHIYEIRSVTDFAE